MTGSVGARRRVMGARMVAAARWPYVATMLYSLQPVELPSSELSTIAVDKGWRLYYCAEFVASCTPEELATALLHECQHLMRDHAGRFDALHQPSDLHPTWNAAGDAVINDVLDEAGMPWPAIEPIRYATLAPLGVTPGMTTEAAYFAMLQAAPSEGGRQNGASDGDEGSPADGGAGRQDETSEGAGTDPDSTRPPSRGTATAGGSDADQPPSSPQAPIADCGSAAGGAARPYELRADDADAPGLGQAQQDLIRDRVAQAIVDHAKGIGDVPAGLLRWAEESLRPAVDWRRVLAGFIRSGLAAAAGRRDYSFQFPSRRAEALRVPLAGAVLPAMRQPPPPRVAVVLDTSGSIGQEQLQRFASEVHGLVRSVGFSNGFTVIPCDAQAYAPVRIRRVADIASLQLPGGGGTDMSAGLTASMALRPRPDVVIIMTDGWTPWPQDPPSARTAVVVALTDQAKASAVPQWASRVVIETED